VCQACHTHFVNDVTDDSPDGRLRASWIRFVSADTELFDRIVVRHRERHRHYHRLEHVDSVVGHLEALVADEGLGVHDHGLTVAAAMYHDAIYEPRSAANERASARLARKDLASMGWSPQRIEAVATMIEGTSDHLTPADAATAVLFDADLAVLGSDSHTYEGYRAAVRREYHHVPDNDWVSGRADVLRAFLDRAAIYATDSGHDHWEQAARHNLTDELESLAS